MKRATISAAILASVVGLALAYSSCSGESDHGGSGVVLAQPPESAQAFGEVAPFAFTERGGATVKREDLLGEPWIASSIFTRCTGPCPAVTSTMKKLEEKLKRSHTRLVTFSVDPEFDTPAVLRQYAESKNADPKRWLFLTGPTADIDAFIRASFSLPVERNLAVPIGEHVSHSTRLIVIDKRGRVRGMYSGETDADVDAIVARVSFLEREDAVPGTAR